jgi:hypothetical protein
VQRYLTKISAPVLSNWLRWGMTCEGGRLRTVALRGGHWVEIDSAPLHALRSGRDGGGMSRPDHDASYRP